MCAWRPWSMLLLSAIALMIALSGYGPEEAPQDPPRPPTVRSLGASCSLHPHDQRKKPCVACWVLALILRSKARSALKSKPEQPLSLEALRETLRALPGTVYRVKGVTYCADAPQRWAVLQVVGRRMDISLHEEWGQRVPLTQIVAIGAAGEIDPKQLDTMFASCISATAASA